MIFQLLSNNKQRAELGMNAQKRAEKEFNWKFISDKYLSLINKKKN